LQNLGKYKYGGKDHSFIANNFGQPFWNAFVELLPLTMAANMVTVLGFASMVLSYLATLSFCPTLEEQAPSWLYLFNAICLFFYQTMDAVDGKQARRTQTSSPLGELVDHGCDAITTTFLALTLGASVGIGGGWAAWFGMFMATFGFFAAQWEEYHTGILDLGIVGVTEAQLITMVIYMTTSFQGLSLWSTYYFGLQLKHWMTLSVGIPVIYAVYGNTTFMTRWAKENKTDFTTVFFRCAPYVTLVFASAFWGYFSPSQVMQNYPHLYIGMFGMLAANLVSRMVLARVCGEPFPPQQIVLVPMLVGCVLIFVLPGFEFHYLVLCFVHSWVCYLNFAHSVVMEITEFLGIGFLFIKKNPKTTARTDGTQTAPPPQSSASGQKKTS